MREPNFLYLGPDKAGSSWLHEILGTHQQVFLTPAKGLYFFDRYYERGWAWYVAHFDSAAPEHLVVGEVCQDYLAHPEVAERIRRCLGDGVRLMVTLRDPAERAYSSYLHMRRSGWRTGTFTQALDRYPELLEHGRYGAQLARFSAGFPRASLHIAIFEDLQADPQRFLDGVTTWLGIEPLALAPSLLEPRLPAGWARSAAISRVVSTAAHTLRERNGGALVGRVKRVRFVQRALYRPLAQARPQLTDAERALVHDALADDVAMLDERYGLNLAHGWGWAT